MSNACDDHCFPVSRATQQPLFSISQVSTLAASFADDVRAYAAAGVDGIGVWELKLGDGPDDEAFEQLAASGLGSAGAVPAIPSILPLPLLPGPEDPAERIESLCTSVHRLAAFEPSAVVCITGPAGDRDPAEARRIVVEGLRTVAREAEKAGVRLALEPFQREGIEDWAMVNTLGEAAALIEEVGSDALGIEFDVWHLWNTPGLLEEIPRHAHLIAGVHVNDWREPTRDTQRRYTSAGDLEADLARFVVQDERIPDRRPSARRFPAWAAVAAALVVVLAATGVALEIYRNAHRAAAVPSSTTVHSLVVLPLRNASGDAAQDYFVDGMTELLTADLSGVSVLRVIGDSSASRYRGTQKSGADIGRELKVDAVVEGSVARSGNRVRVTLQVVHAGTNLSLWGSSFEREQEDAFALQAEIARTIVAQLKGALTRGEERRLSQTYVAAAAAQDLYLRARYLMHTYNRDQVAESRVLLERAVQIDGNYALAWASLARCYALLQEYGLLSPDESRRLGSTAATTAISLDPDMFEAHSTLAEALFKFDWNWDEADAHYRRALEANPSFSLARWQYARFLSAAGRVDQAVAEALRAEQSDPNSIDVMGTVAMMLFYKRQYAASVDKTTEALALDPRQPGPHFIRGRALAGLGRLDDAAREIEDTVRMTGNQSGQLAELGRVYALAGRRGDAATILARLAAPQHGADAFVAAQDAAYVQLGLGMRSEALSALERAVDQRSERVLWIRVDPRLDSLRADPRFQKLVERIGGLSSAP